MDSQTELESHHGVLMNVETYGVLIIGAPAIGKSSLALELLSQGYQLIADDVVDFYSANNIIIGQCPSMLTGLLHTRELGLISVAMVFGDKACRSYSKVDYIIELTHQIDSPLNLVLEKKNYVILNTAFPLLTLSVTSPASLSTRLLCWLKMQATSNPVKNKLQQGENPLMSFAK